MAFKSFIVNSFIVFINIAKLKEEEEENEDWVNVTVKFGGTLLKLEMSGIIL